MTSRFALLAAALLAALVVSDPSVAATSCATRVLRDWSDDGRVASRYSPPCYEQAIDALPPDLRDYTNAQDVITRALTQAVRTSDPHRTRRTAALGVPRVDPVDRSLPPALVAVVVAAVALLCGGAVTSVVRHRRLEHGRS
jgi:hypothetical protein